MLRAKLYELELSKRRAVSDAAEAQKMDTTFGSQIRNYVLHPYKMVKDLRTGIESGNPRASSTGIWTSSWRRHWRRELATGGPRRAEPACLRR